MIICTKGNWSRQNRIQLYRIVPKLKETHCLHDAWSELNVYPAKIMQVSFSTEIHSLIICTTIAVRIEFLGELHWYTNQKPPPADAGVASETLEHLKACNLLFEKGFLSHDYVRGINSDVIKNINRGFYYFTEWLDSILQKCMALAVTALFETLSHNMYSSRVSAYFQYIKVISVLAK